MTDYECICIKQKSQQTLHLGVKHKKMITPDMLPCYYIILLSITKQRETERGKNTAKDKIKITLFTDNGLPRKSRVSTVNYQ